MVHRSDCSDNFNLNQTWMPLRKGLFCDAYSPLLFFICDLEMHLHNAMSSIIRRSIPKIFRYLLFLVILIITSVVIDYTAFSVPCPSFNLSPSVSVNHSVNLCFTIVKYDIATSTTAVMITVFGIEPRHISNWTGIPTEIVEAIYNRAVERGFDPLKRNFTLIDAYVADASRSGRPSKQTSELQTAVLAEVRRDRYGCENTCDDIASELLDVSATTVWRVLRSACLNKTKPTRKPGLTDQMRTDRLIGVLSINTGRLRISKMWTDETSMILLHRRGSYRIWRTKDEAFLRSCIRERWKGSSEFMFWGSFSYDKKGPYHCWLPETASERRNSEALINA